MEHEDLLDASVEVLASDTQPEESAASLTKRIIYKLNLSSNTRVTETVTDTQTSWNLLNEYNMPVDFIHDHLHADVQLNGSINEHDDIIDHDDAMMSQQSHQPLIDQQGHNDVQPITMITQQGQMQASDVVSGHVVMKEINEGYQSPVLYHTAAFHKMSLKQ